MPGTWGVRRRAAARSGVGKGAGVTRGAPASAAGLRLVGGGGMAGVAGEGAGIGKNTGGEGGLLGHV